MKHSMRQEALNAFTALALTLARFSATREWSLFGEFLSHFINFMGAVLIHYLCMLILSLAVWLVTGKLNGFFFGNERPRLGIGEEFEQIRYYVTVTALVASIGIMLISLGFPDAGSRPDN